MIQTDRAGSVIQTVQVGLIQTGLIYRPIEGLKWCIYKRASHPTNRLKKFSAASRRLRMVRGWFVVEPGHLRLDRVVEPRGLMQPIVAPERGLSRRLRPRGLMHSIVAFERGSSRRLELVEPRGLMQPALFPIQPTRHGRPFGLFDNMLEPKRLHI